MLSSASKPSAVVPDAITRNIVSSRAYGQWNQIFHDFAWLRSNMPLALAIAEGFDPFWVVTKYTDIAEIGRQPSIFKNNGSERLALVSQIAEQRARTLALASGMPAQIRSLVAMDAPEHSIFRRMTFNDFAPKGIRSIEENTRMLARQSLAEMAATGGSCDFVKDVAVRFPLRVILAILGAPSSAEDMMLQMTQEFFSPQDVDLNQSGLVLNDNEAASVDTEVLAKYLSFFDELTDSRRSDPRNDVASTIANSTVNGKLIDHWDAASYYITILTAGHDTTASSTAGAVQALAERPDLFAKVKADRTLIPALVEESIRWTTPVNHFMRTATQDYVLRGQTVRKGDWLMLCYLSANRDEEIFSEPTEFRIDRKPNQQIAFGLGPHVCLGQHLARMEMRVFLEELLEKLTHVELAGSPQRSDATFISGLKSLPINFRFD